MVKREGVLLALFALVCLSSAPHFFSSPLLGCYPCLLVLAVLGGAVLLCFSLDIWVWEARQKLVVRVYLFFFFFFVLYISVGRPAPFRHLKASWVADSTLE